MQLTQTLPWRAASKLPGEVLEFPQLRRAINKKHVHTDTQSAIVDTYYVVISAQDCAPLLSLQTVPGVEDGVGSAPAALLSQEVYSEDAEYGGGWRAG